MATSEVDIVNKALVLLGVDPIASLNEPSKPAETAKRVYQTSRDDVLRGYAWGFASLITTLASIAGESIPGFTYLYTYPVNCLRVRRVYANYENPYDEGVDFRELLTPVTFQRCIATTINPAYVEYTFKMQDPNQFDAAFIEALSFKLAAVLASDLTGDKQIGFNFQTLYLAQISEAKRLDFIEKKKTVNTMSTYQKARA